MAEKKATLYFVGQFMNYVILIAICIVILGIQDVAYSIDKHFNFELGERKEHLKIIIAEFSVRRKPNSKIGKSLSYLIWREVRAAVGSSSGTSVILLDDSKESNLKNLGRSTALNIVKSRNAALILWGELREKTESASFKLTGQSLDNLREEGLPGEILENLESLENQHFNEQEKFLEAVKLELGDAKTLRYKKQILKHAKKLVFEIVANLTLNSDFLTNYLYLRLVDRSKSPPAVFRAKLPNYIRHKKIISQEDMKNKMFARQIVTRISATLYEDTSIAHPVNLELPAGVRLRSEDMHGDWFELRLKKRDTSYSNTVYIKGHQVMLPTYVDLESRNAHLGNDPCNQSVSARNAELPASFFVTRSQLTLPIEHLIVGLSHYWSRRFDASYWEFFQFIHSVDPTEASKGNVRYAYHLQGASLMLKPPDATNKINKLEAFSKAAKCKPFDPDVYNLRALAMLGVSVRSGRTGEIDKYIANDLDQALHLDSSNDITRKLLRQIDKHNAFDLPREEKFTAVAQIERILESDHEKLPPELEITKKLRGNVVRLKAENDTEYDINLYFFSTQTCDADKNCTSDRQYKVVPKNGGKIEIELRSDIQYEVAAEVDIQDLQEGSIRPMYGKQTYKSQTEYRMKFYRNWFGKN